MLDEGLKGFSGSSLEKTFEQGEKDPYKSVGDLAGDVVQVATGEAEAKTKRTGLQYEEMHRIGSHCVHVHPTSRPQNAE